MARSSYIYVVVEDDDRQKIIAAFTVKHEMETWCKKNDSLPIIVFRCKDGIHQRPFDCVKIEI